MSGQCHMGSQTTHQRSKAVSKNDFSLVTFQFCTVTVDTIIYIKKDITDFIIIFV